MNRDPRWALSLELEAKQTLLDELRALATDDPDSHARQSAAETSLSGGAAAFGTDPNPLEGPSQAVRPGDRHNCEDGAHRKGLSQRSAQPEKREAARLPREILTARPDEFQRRPIRDLRHRKGGR
jgi:hypothetical protein